MRILGVAGKIEKLELYQNFPNPFNSMTKIYFDIPHRVNVKMCVYDILGKKIADMINEELDAGSYVYIFSGNNLSSGTYFYIIDAGINRKVKKFTYIK